MTTEIARFMLKLEEMWDEHLACRWISRTVDRFHLVDETTVSFTQRVLWDHATLSAQLGLAGSRPARRSG